MNSFLRQATASQSRSTPSFVSDTDFKTLQTGLTIANTDVKLIANGGSSANKNSGGGTHRANGCYGLTFDATDSATVGELMVSISVAGALPVFMKFWVLEEAIYDALFGASAAGYFTAAGYTAPLDAAGTRAAVGLTSADLDTQIATLSTASALANAKTAIDAIKAKTDNLPSDPADQSLIIAATDAITSAIAALNNLSSAQAQTAAAAALAAYDGPTNAEMEARTIAAANYATATNLAAAKTVVDAIKVVTDALTALGAAVLAETTGTMVKGTVTNAGVSPSTTVFEASDITEATADHFNGRSIVFLTGALANQATSITDYSLVSGRGRLTVVALTEAPANGDTFRII